MSKTKNAYKLIKNESKALLVGWSSLLQGALTLVWYYVTQTPFFTCIKIHFVCLENFKGNFQNWEKKSEQEIISWIFWYYFSDYWPYDKTSNSVEDTWLGK